MGDQVYLKVSPWKGILRFGKKEKLSPRYIGPYEIIERVGTLAYKLDLPPELSRIHNVFHICMLRKYVPHHSHVIRPEPVEIQSDLTYAAEPVQILSREVKQLRSKRIPLVKVLWPNQHREEATWEREDEMKEKYPYLFDSETY